MKVHELIKQLTDELNPDEEIIALVYHKSMFTDGGLELTDEGWFAVADTFYKHYDDTDLFVTISSACIDESEESEEE